MKCFIRFFIVLTLCWLSFAQKRRVDVQLSAVWQHTSLAAEASEFVAEKEASAFWQFVNALGTLKCDSDKQCYETVMQATHSILDENERRLLDYALSLRFYSARVEMFRQVANSHLETLGDGAQQRVDRCEAVAVLDGRATCELDQLRQWLSTTAPNYDDPSQLELSEPAEIDADHRHAPALEAGDGVRVVVLYAAIGTAAFAPFHAFLSERSARNVRYILRHWDAKTEARGNTTPTYLSGFGVELSLKNLEYKAVDDSELEKQSAEAAAKRDADGGENDDEELRGFRFDILQRRKPELREELRHFRDFLRSTEQRMDDLKVWELQHLGTQAAQRIVSADDPLRALTRLAQDFPTACIGLSRLTLNETLQQELADTAKLLQPGSSFATVNGRRVDPNTIDAFTLYTLMQGEVRKAAAFSDLHISRRDALHLQSLSLKTSDKPRFDVRDSEAIVFVNDLSRDQMYGRWPSTLQSFVNFKPNWMQQLPNVRLNLFTGVVMIDPSHADGLQLGAIMSQVIRQQIPIRVGVLMRLELGDTDDIDEATDTVAAIANDPSHAQYYSVLMARLFHVLLNELTSGSRGQSSGAHALLLFGNVLQSLEPAAERLDRLEPLQITWDEFNGHFSNIPTFNKAVATTAFDEKIARSALYTRSFGIKGNAIGFLNGVLCAEDVANCMVRQVQQQVTPLQEYARSGALVKDKEKDLYTQILNGLGDTRRAFKHYSKYVEPTRVDPLNFVNLVSNEADKLLSTLQWVSAHETGDIRTMSHVLAVDLGDRAGARTARDFVLHTDVSKDSRVALVCNSASAQSLGARRHAVLSAALASVRESKRYTLASALLSAWADSEAHNDHVSGTDIVIDAELSAVGSVDGVDVDEAKVREAALAWLGVGGADSVFSVHRFYCEQALDLDSGRSAFITNGRLIWLDEGDTFDGHELDYLEAYESRFGDVLSALQSMTFVDVDPDAQTSAFMSDVLMKVVSVLGMDEAAGVSKQRVPKTLHRHLTLRSGGADSECLFDVVAVLNPLSRAAQRFAPMLRTMMDAFDTCVSVVLNTVPKYSEPPLKTFYDFQLSPRLQFDARGALRTPTASFGHLPADRLLTLHLDHHESWLVSPVVAKYDLDNIRLDTMQDGDDVLYALFEVQHVLTEGNCMDLSAGGQPPRGLQLRLGTPAQPHMVDTTVMSNFGYFQLKSLPGVWTIGLAEGRSNELYEIVAEGEVRASHRVVVSGFDGAFERLKVRKQAGKESIELLGEPTDEELGDDDLMSQLSAMMGGSAHKKKKKKGEKAVVQVDENETLHVFSVASGHLYERFLKIMMLTVRQHTKNPVKFWILSNFISPRFKNFIPHMAKKYNFDVELVTYKWPSWLHKQTEKQRIIWGYKILFLDVLFPLDVKKIVYIDADQIVQADIKELWEMDLEGAPYAYTPFCSDKTEMDGFRFWISGYWKQHLQGRPYHISALYFVDLAVFRRQAAGDQLRATYDSLSRDPNSLANLDQDLPNYLQGSVRIHSLPQEWLWCETWCGDDWKDRAKTIDLCNNPLTKSPKLDNAVRIVEGWSDYDLELKQLEDEVSAKQQSGDDGGQGGDEDAPKESARDEL